MVDSVSPALARRIALAAQGFGRRSSAAPGTRQLTAAIERLTLLQIDSVNVFERSHYLPLFSRLGAYDKSVLDRVAHGRRARLIEYWAHQAALIPRESLPLFGWRMEAYRRKWAGDPDSWWSRNTEMLDWLRSELAEKGPLRASEIEHDANVRRGPWWGWSEVKEGLEHLFFVGDIVCADRSRFERIYALPEHALPREALDRPAVPREEAIRELVRRAAVAHGIGTVADFADYFRLKIADTTIAVRALEDAGELLPVRVPGWTSGGREARVWLHRDARRPRRVEGASVLSPFDPVVWFRPRAERLFGFHYRIEIYTPEPKRVFGYYSLPILLDDDVVGRVDLKSDRQAGVLRVQSAWHEEGAPAETAERLLRVLREAAEWQGLGEVVVGERGTLAGALRALA